MKSKQNKIKLIQYKNKSPKRTNKSQGLNLEKVKLKKNNKKSLSYYNLKFKIQN